MNVAIFLGFLFPLLLLIINFECSHHPYYSTVCKPRRYMKGMVMIGYRMIGQKIVN